MEDNIDTVSKYLERIDLMRNKYNELLKSEFTTYNDSLMELYYRGQSDYSWKLVPGLFRAEADKINERNLILSASRYNINIQYLKNYEKFNFTNVLEIMSDLQHYHKPTRLLDWSDKPLIALYFACCELEDVNGKIFIASDYDKFCSIIYGNTYTEFLKLKINLITNLSLFDGNQIEKIINLLDENSNDLLNNLILFENKRIETFKKKKTYDNERLSNINEVINGNERLKKSFENESSNNKYYNDFLCSYFKKFIPNIPSKFEEAIKQRCFLLLLNNLLHISFFKYRGNDRSKRQSCVFSLHFGKVLSSDNKIFYTFSESNKDTLIPPAENMTYPKLSDFKISTILIHSSKKKKILKELDRDFGISKSSLFPDRYDYFIDDQYNKFQENDFIEKNI